MARRLSKQSDSAPTPAEAAYRRLLAEQAASGLGMRAFARSRGVSPATLSWWKWEIARRDRERGHEPGPVLTPTLLPVKFVDERPRVVLPLEVVLVGGRVIRVPVGSDLRFVRELADALEHSC